MSYIKYKNGPIGIYKITNLINGKFYIGSTVSIKRRFCTHKHQLNKRIHHNKHLQHSWNIYGENKFQFELLCICKENELKVLEQYLLDKWYGKEQCYNESPSATQANIGKPRSEEYRMKMKEYWKLRRLKPDWEDAYKILRKNALLNGFKLGFKHTPQTIDKFKGRTSSFINIKKAYESNRGRRYPKEHCNNISVSKLNSKKHLTEEEKQRIREGVKRAVLEGRYHKNKVPKEEYQKIKELYLSGNYTKKKLADIYNINAGSMAKILIKSGV